MNVIAALIGAGIAGGLLLIVDGLRSSPQPSTRQTKVVVDRDWMRRRLAPALAVGLPVALITRWPVAAVGLAVAGWFSSELLGSKAARERATTRTEAIAAWTEMLRDTMSGAHGLEEAVITTAAVAPAAIKAEVTALAVRVQRHSLSEAFRTFAAELAHPTGDLVVAALTLAAGGSVGDLGELLGTLAVSAREEAGMRLRVEAARARMRTSVRVIAACTAATAVGLVLLNRSYLNVYATGIGQVVLAGVAISWAAAFWWLARMSEFIAPERFLATPVASRDPEAVR